MALLCSPMEDKCSPLYFISVFFFFFFPQISFFLTEKGAFLHLSISNPYSHEKSFFFLQVPLQDYDGASEEQFEICFA